MTQSNDLPSRRNRAEDNIIDLKLAVSATLQAIDKNSADIAQLVEVSRRNSEAITALRETTATLTTALLEVNRNHDQRLSVVESAAQDIRNMNVSLVAAIERMDRLIDYLMRRDQERTGE